MQQQAKQAEAAAINASAAKEDAQAQVRAAREKTLQGLSAALPSSYMQSTWGAQYETEQEYVVWLASGHYALGKAARKRDDDHLCFNTPHM